MIRTASGKITSIDAAARTVTLDSGTVFKLAAPPAPDLAVGEQVKVSYDDASGSPANATVTKA